MTGETNEFPEEPTPQAQGQYYQPVIMPSEKADLYDKIRPEDVVETIKHLLMGYEWDIPQQKWIFNEAFKTLAISQIGAWQLSTLLLPVSNKNVSISKLNDSDIRMRTRYIIRTAMKMCLRNWKEYGIRSPEQLFFVKEVIISVAFITLKQPENAGVRTFIQGTRNEQHLVQEQPKKEGLRDAIFRR